MQDLKYEYVVAESSLAIPPRVMPRHLHALGRGCESIDPVGQVLEGADIVMADHEDLEAEPPPGLVDEADEAGHEVGPQPAILLVEHEEAPVLAGVEPRDREDPERGREDVRDRAALAAKNVPGLAVPLDVERD